MDIVVSGRARQPLDRNIAMELVRVTEAAALSASRYMGLGDKELVDQAAVDAMRFALGSIEMDGIVVIGEGEKDEAPMLYNGERIGNGSPPEVDIAVDPIDGTTLLANGLPGSVAVIALAERGAMNCPTETFYMDKIAVGHDARDVIDINASVDENLKAVANAKHRDVRDLVVMVLDRPRHEPLLNDIRAAGARVRLISDGDVAAGIHAAMPTSDIDVLMGIGGTPEGVLTAAALRCIDGRIVAKPWPRDDAEREAARNAGVLDKIYDTDDLCGGDDVFFAVTGASTGDLLRGVNYVGGGAETHSLVMRSRSGTLRWVDSLHDFSRLDKLRFSPDVRAQ